MINVEEISELITKWIDITNVANVDLENSNVPAKFLKYIINIKTKLKVFECLQSKNTQTPAFMSKINEYLGIDLPVSHPKYTAKKIFNLHLSQENLLLVFELLTKATEENSLNEKFDEIFEVFSSHKIPISRYKFAIDKNSDKFYIKKEDENTEYEFIDTNIFKLKQLLANPYSEIIGNDIQNLLKYFAKYLNFLNDFTHFEKFWFICDEFFQYNLNEFQREIINNKDIKHINANENCLRLISKGLKESSTLKRYLDSYHDKVIEQINNGLKNYEEIFKVIEDFLDYKRKEIMKYYFLTNKELIEVVSMNNLIESFKTHIAKMFPGINKMEFGIENEEIITVTTDDSEVYTIRIPKSKAIMKEIIECFESETAKKISQGLRSCKKLLKDTRIDIQKFREIAGDMVREGDYLAQVIFMVIYSNFSESIDKALRDNEVFDRLIDVKNESKDRKLNLFKLLQNPKSTDIEKMKAINNLCLENYFYEIIKNLIREDTSSSTDFSWIKYINVYVESESCKITHMNFSQAYGNQYVGLFNNFIITPQTERIFITMTNNFSVKKPMFLYSLPFSGKRETIKMLSKICGITNVSFQCSDTVDIKAFKKLVYGCAKAGLYGEAFSGFWLSLDSIDNLKFEVMSVIAQDIMSIYQNLGDKNSQTFSNELKIPMNIIDRNFQIFCLSGIHKKHNISINMKMYFRLIGLIAPDLLMFIGGSLRNYRVPQYRTMGRKIKLVLEYFNNKSKIFQGKSIGLSLFNKFLKLFRKKITLKPQEDYPLLIRETLIDVLAPILSNEEYEDLKRYLMVMFDIPFLTKQKSLNGLTSELKSVIGKTAKKYNYNNLQFNDLVLSVSTFLFIYLYYE